MPYVITRQDQWSTGEKVVEISEGTIDFTNADALARKYKNEFKEIDNPSKAVEVGIDIAKQWQKDCPKDTIKIAMGNTHGFSMPFEGEPLCEETYSNLRNLAMEIESKMQKCDTCNKTIYGESHDFRGFHFCNEKCLQTLLSNDEDEDEDEDTNN